MQSLKQFQAQSENLTKKSCAGDASSAAENTLRSLHLKYALLPLYEPLEGPELGGRSLLFGFTGVKY